MTLKIAIIGASLASSWPRPPPSLRERLTIPDVKRIAPEFYKLVNGGSVFSISDGKALNGRQLGDGSINASYYGYHEEDFTQTRGFDTRDPSSAKNAFREALHDCRLLAAYKKGVTLLGDAAHLMTPFSGIGVNTEFYYAMLLTQPIFDSAKQTEPKHLDTRIITYEENLWGNAKNGAEWT
ncbi:uncharacterized protein BDR25DRAFT_317727 [Lindgomyces ingoldianus]|uniref:Uncharacterized protein n=1 Tax=Lindgomyces ingoldianus TaxID=673940 RepID=A0ACB6QH65_9PLEO|nr:uncharacterized protein BDR25DRAFT_317727 [Lindgomyces ingoldianus]KAF2466333.1 hypothetical protein BDR25DRAFT_317727 [Lindgomyces ingoldianus]